MMNVSGSGVGFLSRPIKSYEAEIENLENLNIEEIENILNNPSYCSMYIGFDILDNDKRHYFSLLIKRQRNLCFQEIVSSRRLNDFTWELGEDYIYSEDARYYDLSEHTLCSHVEDEKIVISMAQDDEGVCIYYKSDPSDLLEFIKNNELKVSFTLDNKEDLIRSASGQIGRLNAALEFLKNI